MTVILTVLVFAGSMMGLGAGLILSNRMLKGTCASEAVGRDGEPLACGSCSRKAADVCPSDDPVVRLAQISHPNPRHHH